MDEPNPIMRVTVGAPIYTRDEQRIGKVKEVRSHEFKVETGLFQRDYWLSEESIESAEPGEAVILAVASTDLDAYKVEQPRAA